MTSHAPLHLTAIEPPKPARDEAWFATRIFPSTETIGRVLVILDSDELCQIDRASRVPEINLVVLAGTVDSMAEELCEALSSTDGTVRDPDDSVIARRWAEVFEAAAARLRSRLS